MASKEEKKIMAIRKRKKRAKPKKQPAAKIPPYSLPKAKAAKKTAPAPTVTKPAPVSAPSTSAGPSLAMDVDLSSDSNMDEEDYDDSMLRDSECEEQEDPRDYRPGGYLVVNLGDVLNGHYYVIRKIGWGHFSTVWLGWDVNHLFHSSLSSKQFVALKIVKSAEHYAETAQDEIKLLNSFCELIEKSERGDFSYELNEDIQLLLNFRASIPFRNDCSVVEKVRNSDPDDSKRDRVINMLDHFTILGDHGIHVCMVFEVLGHNLLRMIIQTNYRGIPIPQVKRIMKQVLEGVEYLHNKCKIIHTDIKPENVLVCLSHEEIFEMAKDAFLKQRAGIELSANAVCATSSTPSTNRPAARAKNRKLKDEQALFEEELLSVFGLDSSSCVKMASPNGKVEKRNSCAEDRKEPSPTVGLLPEQISKMMLCTDTQNGNNAESSSHCFGPQPAMHRSPSLDRQCATNADQANVVAKSIFAHRVYSSIDGRNACQHCSCVVLDDPEHHLCEKLKIDVDEHVSGESMSAEIPKGNLSAVKRSSSCCAVFQVDLDEQNGNLGKRNACCFSRFFLCFSLNSIMFKTAVVDEQSKEAKIIPASKPVSSNDDEVLVKIADLGNGCWVDNHFTEDIQTRQYRALEVLIGSGYSTPADIWSVACMAFELATGEFLFEPKTSDNYSRDEDHLAHIIELLGPIPRNVLSRGLYTRSYFTRSGALKRIRNLRPWGLKDILITKYEWAEEEAESFTSFLLPMLEYDPSKRATATDCLAHPWLNL
ncbi:SRSF protein kinase 1 [Trichinella nativa]|uniref:non-specific serine/threonine protein kinase n=1 Tax=Trichinella nativa TaxID=6335 RepID=A0A0V1LJ32_9BILA|nr:SRSF protein kinase 1 [Trichinella nativa]